MYHILEAPAGTQGAGGQLRHAYLFLSPLLDEETPLGRACPHSHCCPTGGGAQVGLSPLPLLGILVPMPRLPGHSARLPHVLRPL